jgi:cytochrome b561
MTRPVFTLASRILHWAMAALIIAMLFIGVAMVASLSNYHRLVSIHEPIGIAILALAAIRLINRLFNPPPPLPADMPRLQKVAAKASHVALYGLMFGLPIVGWAMLSAGDYPLDLYGSWAWPHLLSPDPTLYAWLRRAHTALAYALFATILTHLAAALLHGLILRDGVFGSMASLSLRSRVPHDNRS